MRRRSDFYPTFPSIVNDFLRGDLSDWMNLDFPEMNITVPAMNVIESEDNFTIEVAAPGMQKEDFKVNLDRNILTISSERKEERNSDGEGKFNRREFSYQSFQRSFNVPDNMVEGDKIEAKYKDGILYVTLPKKEEAKRVVSKPREISIA